jgi:hypothetical protein
MNRNHVTTHVVNLNVANKNHVTTHVVNLNVANQNHVTTHVVNLNVASQSHAVSLNRVVGLSSNLNAMIHVAIHVKNTLNHGQYVEREIIFLFQWFNHDIN